MGVRRDSRRGGWRTISAGLLTLVLVAGLAVLWVQAPGLYGRSVTAKRAATTTRAGILLLGVALIAAAIAGAAVWVNHRTSAETQQANREAQKGNQEALAETQRANREEDQRTRYSTAIEQLGSDQRSVRVGAIYTLERLADYSEGDQRIVVEVMSAYIRDRHRQSAPAKKLDSPTGREREEHHQASPKLPTDEQAALTVLGRLRWREGVPRPDLTGTDFAETDLVGVNLSGAHLDSANLSGAHLGWGSLSGADLDWANLSGTRLGWTNLSGARLFQANLSGARLFQANLSGADLGWANLSGADLDWANLSGARLGKANLSGADLGGANLSGAHLDGANLREARNLQQGQLDSAEGDALTELPEGLQRPSSWAGAPGHSDESPT